MRGATGARFTLAAVFRDGGGASTPGADRSCRGSSSLNAHSDFFEEIRSPGPPAGYGNDLRAVSARNGGVEARLQPDARRLLTAQQPYNNGSDRAPGAVGRLGAHNSLPPNAREALGHADGQRGDAGAAPQQIIAHEAA